MPEERKHPFDSTLDAIQIMQNSQAEALEALECSIYEEEGEFLRALEDIGSYLSIMHAYTHPAKCYRKVRCSLREEEDSPSTPHESQSQSSDTNKQQKAEPSRPNTFLAVKRSEAQYEAVRSSFTEPKEYLLAVSDDTETEDDTKYTDKLFTPLYFSHKDVPNESDRIVTLSSATALAAVEKRRKFLISSDNPVLPKNKPSSPRYTPFAMFSGIRGIVKNYKSTQKDDSAQKGPIKRKTEE